MTEGPAEILARAENAQRILNDPAVTEALALLEREAIEQWIQTKATDIIGREALWQWVRMAQRFGDIFRAAIQDGEILKEALKERDLNL